MTTLFERNKLAAYKGYLSNHEVVPHPWNSRYYLTKTSDGGISGVANSCIHRAYKLVNERKTLKPGELILCDFHHWTYDRQGELVAAPGFKQPIPCKKLPDVQLTDINGFFFETESVKNVKSIEDFFKIPEIANIWLDDFTFSYETKTTYNVEWQSFMEIYLDGYHVKPFHPGLGSYLNCDDMKWYFGEQYSLQINELCKPDANFDKSQAWGDFHKQVLKVGWDQTWGAMFGTIYPGLMIEFYPHLFVISQIIPSDKDNSIVNHVQVYADSTVASNTEFLSAFGRGYDETAREDGYLQDLLEEGRKMNWYDPKDLLAHELFEAGLTELDRWVKSNK